MLLVNCEVICAAMEEDKLPDMLEATLLARLDVIWPISWDDTLPAMLLCI